jgi:hypothetical protein
MAIKKLANYNPKGQLEEIVTLVVFPTAGLVTPEQYREAMKEYSRT